jgi:nucleotide-binding universal stress UspA family protein
MRTPVAEAATTVVGVDGEVAGWQALAWAADEVNRGGGRLLIARVYPPGGAAGALTPSPSMAALELADPILARAVTACRGRLGGDRVLVTVRIGDPVHHLVQIADRASLLVVGSSAAAGRPPLATIAGRLAARAAATVAVVRPVPDATGPFPGHVVVGVDGQGPAGAALAYAFGHAARHRLPLAVVHVGAGAAVDLAAAIEPWREAYPHQQVRAGTLPGRPAEALPAAARGARLLVVGDRGRSSAVRRLLGSVSQAALAHAAGPVVVAHGICGYAPFAGAAAAYSAGLR